MDFGLLKQEMIEIAKIVHQFPEQVQQQVFVILTENLDGGRQSPTSGHREKDAPADDHMTRESEEETANKAPGKRVRKTAASKESYRIDRELNLRGDKSIPSFKDFAEEKKPSSAKEFNAVTVYYLKKLAAIEHVTLDHAYTCYSEMKRRPPEHFRQSFNDAKTKEGWVEFDAEGFLNIPHRGIVFVEHDLPKSTKAPKATQE
jgi:hypothetical protein